MLIFSSLSCRQFPNGPEQPGPFKLLGEFKYEKPDEVETVRLIAWLTPHI
jgi:hypothetical protein